MTNTHRIKKATESDAAAIHEVLYRTWMDTYPNEEYGITIEHIGRLIAADDQVAIEKRRQMLREIPASRCTYVAIMHDKTVGVCGGFQNDEFAQLKYVYVLPEFQGMGIGGSLLETFKNWSGTKMIIVNVAVYNEKAIGFYKNHGFVDTGKRFTEERYVFGDGKSIPEMELKTL